ncbi:MAG: metal-dependent transcriptional regulator, partial [Ruminococcus sp.]|nr:metal-dependent transcriptional regulator [Ruminococcus sp.]
VKAIRELKARNLATQMPYSAIELTPEGHEAAKQVLARHTLLRDFLLKLGVGRAAADADACRMEHVVSDKSFAAIKAYFHYNEENAE